MSTRFVKQITPQKHGDVLTAFSDGLVGLLKEFYGRGPTRTKSYYKGDLVVCVLRGGFSRVEQTLLEGGRGCESLYATPRVSSPPIATSASMTGSFTVARTVSTPPSILWGLVRDVPRMVPPLAGCRGTARC